MLVIMVSDCFSISFINITVVDLFCDGMHFGCISSPVWLMLMVDLGIFFLYVIIYVFAPGSRQKYCKASVGCLQPNLLPQNLHYKGGNYLQDFLEVKDDMSTFSGGGPPVPNRKIGQISSLPPFDGYYRPVHHQEVEVWASFYPEIQKAQQHNFYVGGANFYPLNYEYGFPIENQFQYVPFSMASSTQSCKQDSSHWQEFQYFVVIDFEATCDRDRNPHPQEIIEFPSVLVNSSTGQLEDCFQIYVQPTYNRHLSDFCKELTGIQQNQVNL